MMPAPMDKPLIAYVRSERYFALDVREWGLPTGGFVGSTWRFGGEDDRRMAVLVSQGPKSVVVQVAGIVLVDGRERFPAGWRKAFASYVRAWPASSWGVACWADLSDRERNQIALRVLAPDAPSEPRDAAGEYVRRRTAAAILGGGDQ